MQEVYMVVLFMQKGEEEDTAAEVEDIILVV